MTKYIVHIIFILYALLLCGIIIMNQPVAQQITDTENVKWLPITDYDSSSYLGLDPGPSSIYDPDYNSGKMHRLRGSGQYELHSKPHSKPQHKPQRKSNKYKQKHDDHRRYKCGGPRFNKPRYDRPKFGEYRPTIMNCMRGYY